MDARVTMGLLFYPRGGSAQVVELPRAARSSGVGWYTPARLRLARRARRAHPRRRRSSTASTCARPTTARRSRRTRRGEDPIAHSPIPHAPVVRGPPGRARPDLRRGVARARRPPGRAVGGGSSSRATARRRSMLHLHHLSPLQEAFAARVPGHAAGDPPARHRHEDDRPHRQPRRRWPGSTAPTSRAWPTAPRRATSHRSTRSPRSEREPGLRDPLGAVPPRPPLGRSACAPPRAPATRFIVISPHDRDEAARLLPTSAATTSSGSPTGSTPDLFDRRDARAPRSGSRAGASGWWRTPTAGTSRGEPGSIRYTERTSRRSPTRTDAPVLLFVGRFLDFKRVPLLVRAYAARARALRPPRAARDLGRLPRRVGGRAPAHGGQRGCGVPDVFFVGWRGHARPRARAAVLRRDGGAVGERAVRPGVPGGDGLRLPVIATRSGGPLSRS